MPPETLTGVAIDAMTASAARLRAWLRDNGAEHIVNQKTEERALRVAVVRRQRRNRMTREPPIRGVTSALSLTQFNAMLRDMNTKGYGPKDYLCFNAKLIQVDMLLTTLRHNSTCRGVIKHTAGALRAPSRRLANPTSTCPSTCRTSRTRARCTT